MKIQNRIQLSLLHGGVVVFDADSGRVVAQPAALRDARLAVQDARDAGAAELAPDKLNLAAGDLAAAQREWNSGHEAMAMHFAQLADSEARDAEFRARGIHARQALESERRRPG